MSIVKYNPHRPVSKTFGNFFDDFFNRNLTDMFGSDFSTNVPSVNVVETEKAYKIELAAPGLEKGDFELKTERDFLTISAKREQKDEVNGGKYFRREFNYSSFSRSFQIPDSVDATAIDANYENGVLLINLPKKEEVIESNTSRVIEIK